MGTSRWPGTFGSSGNPVGYEVSFFAPQGLSGAPLVSTVHGAPRCYGYMVQQGSLGIGGDVTPVGIAVAIEVLLTVASTGRPFARAFGREPVKSQTTGFLFRHCRAVRDRHRR